MTREEFQAAPKDFQKHYRELNGYIDKYLQTEKKQKSEQADFQRELQTIQMLVSAPNKDLVKDGVAKAAELLIRVKEKYPTNTEVIEGMELIVANAQLAAGDSKGAMERLTKLASTTEDSDIKDQAQLLQAQAALEAHQPDQAIQILRSVKETTTDFYARADHEGAWYGKLGLAGTFAGDQVSSVFTMPATIVDYKASDAERAGAITGTTLMAFGGGLLKAGGPVVLNALGSVGRRVAIAKWVSKKLVALERGFENTAVAKTADKIKDGIKNGVDKVKNIVSSDKLRPPTSVEQAVNEVLDGKSLDQARASITPQDMAAMEEKLIKARLADVKRNLTKDVIADLERAGTSPADIDRMAAQRVDRIVEKDFSKERLRKLVREEFSEDDIRRMALGDRIYKDIYHGDFPPKTVNITNQEYAAELARAKGTPTNEPNKWNMPGDKGIVKEDDYWHHRLSKVDGEVGLDAAAIQEGKDIRRFYFNLEPDKAAGLADYLTEKLGDAKIRYQFKMPKQVERVNPKPGETPPFDRPDAGVLYVGKGDYQAVKNIVLEYAKKHSEAFAEDSPGFTKPLAKGIAAADEPLQQGLPPKGTGRYSFGELRSHLIADAFVQAPAGVTKEQLLQLVRQRLDWYGLDANRPWLSRSTTVDDL